MLSPFTFFLVFALVMWAAFFWGVFRERRQLRNGVYLSLALANSYMALLLLPGLPTELGLLLAFGGFALVVLLIAFTCVFLIINGVVMLRREGRSLGNMLSLFAGLGILILGFVGIYAMSSGLEVLIASAWTALLLTGYLGYLLVTFLLYAFVYGRMQPRGNPDHVIILGSGLIGGLVPPLLASRLDKGASIYWDARAAKVPAKIVVSGGQGADEDRSEASAMAEYLAGKGIPAQHILIENQAATTEENLRFSQELIDNDGGSSETVIVTNNFHVFRAALLARRAGLPAQAVGSPTAGYFLPSAALREFVALLMMYRWLHLAVILFITLSMGALLLVSMFSLRMIAEL